MNHRFRTTRNEKYKWIYQRFVRFVVRWPMKMVLCVYTKAVYHTYILAFEPREKYTSILYISNQQISNSELDPIRARNKKDP